MSFRIAVVSIAIVSLTAVTAGDTLRFRPQLPSNPTAELLKNNQCPDNTTCADNTTCCKKSEGSYGCCPYDKGVCCLDQVHCCPQGYTCDIAKKSCEQFLDDAVPWVSKLPSVDNQSGAVPCPGGKMSCPDGNTCCESATGEWGCCPLKKAVCCADHIHCCPHGRKCNSKTGMCERAAVEMMEIVDKTPCPGGQTYCPGTQTCCKISSVAYGCCPFTAGVCCSDHLHCCPSGYTCDVTHGACTQKGSTSDVMLSLITPSLKKDSNRLIEQLPAQKVSLSVRHDISTQEVCPGGNVTCPRTHSCCKTQTGDYGCCPIDDGVCCSDGLHCCPPGTTCDLHLQRCNKVIANVESNDQKCPDGSSCPEDTTCCPLPKLTPGYGCCTEKDGVCCPDHIHCCPHGQKCDSNGCSSKKGLRLPWSTNQPSTPPGKSKTALGVNTAGDVVCPGGKFQCPTGMTCCKMPGGAYGCCPLPKATCCPDLLHCCPHGTECGQGGLCKGSSGITRPAAKKLPAVIVPSVICPDRTKCQTKQTCCPIGGDKYACCPSPEAVCCADHLHCCPQGYACDPSSGECTQDPDAISYIRRLFVSTTTSPMSLRHKVTPPDPTNVVVCPDKISMCPDGMTCCLTLTQQYACCPEPQAVCCKDHLHCCPHGTQCDLQHEACVSQNTSVAWSTKVPSKSVMQKSRVKAVKCVDGTECPDGATCCKMTGGQYGCCPMVQAVCCDDLIHCCPGGYTCTDQGCTQQDVITVFTLLITQTHLQSHGSDLELHGDDLVVDVPVFDKPDVQCPDNKTVCPSGNTCCEMMNGFGCCNHTNATCCNDGRHCCTSTQRCGPSGQCLDVAPWYKRLMTTPISQIEETEDNPCPNPKYKCHRGTTCCPRGGEVYGCCPYPRATCCRDMEHCCPNGFKCNEERRSCFRLGSQGTVAEFVQAVTLSNAEH